ncbi:tRNA (adenosine(37)-N6)-threonylcarbamoyltransferase complex transferase subunit TsaD [Candidatus Babeliales bacterium]|nr:tRNA (adenosine(37)-N6)-threonylcarbamoyltransferase complex transferase subunit TsaD [Candidatus Babeliales bacterium]
MCLVLGIETSCDETAAAVFDSSKKVVLSNSLFSQIALHEKFGGIMPEVASRSHVEKIDIIVQDALDKANITLDDISAVAVTQTPGLVGSLLVGICFAKGIAMAKNKKLLGINHNEAHIYSSLLSDDGFLRNDVPFSHLCLSVSGGHTSMFLVHDREKYEVIGQTLDDAAGEAFDKVSKLLGLGYPGGPVIEKLAREMDFKDFFDFPRPRDRTSLDFSFSGLKTAVLYKLVELGVYDLRSGIIPGKADEELQKKVASSLLVCIADTFAIRIKAALKKFPDVAGVSMVGGVACNKYIRNHLSGVCSRRGKAFLAPPPKFCTDNAAMVALVGALKAERGEYSLFSLDVGR